MLLMSSLESQPPNEGVQELLREFLEAFDSLDLERFLACWGEDATVIHPMREMAKRLDGREEVQGAWRGVFDYLRATRSGPPYLDLRPLAVDVQVQTAGVGAAVATFHLALDESLGRRTLVLEDRAGSWKIVHLHASNV